MSDNVISVRGLTKKFGNLKAVDRINFDIGERKLIGFVGPNGAGKTTTIKMILGLTHPDEGEVFVMGERVDSGKIKHKRYIGFMPDIPVFPEWMKPMDLLVYIGGFFSDDRNAITATAGELISVFGLERQKNRKVEGFSRGEKQRLGMAQAMMGNPKLLILDEPTSGLDPIGRYELISYISGLRNRASVMFSTHLLADVERICDDVIMIDRGAIVLDGSIEGLKSSREGDSLLLEIEGDDEKFVKLAESLSWVKSIKRSDSYFSLNVDDLDLARREIPRIVAAAEAALISFNTKPVSLEDIFLEVTERKEFEESA